MEKKNKINPTITTISSTLWISHTNQNSTQIVIVEHHKIYLMKHLLRRSSIMLVVMANRSIDSIWDGGSHNLKSQIWGDRWGFIFSASTYEWKGLCWWTPCGRHLTIPLFIYSLHVDPGSTQGNVCYYVPRLWCPISVVNIEDHIVHLLHQETTKIGRKWREKLLLLIHSISAIIFALIKSQLRL